MSIAIVFSVHAANKAKELQLFVQNVISLDEALLSGAEPITQLDLILSEKADKSETISKDNIAEMLGMAKSYNKAVIIVGKHTIAIVEDFTHSQPSGAWGTNLPKAKALIQKSGEFNQEEDYLNNLIGIPDQQVRHLFLFK